MKYTTPAVRSIAASNVVERLGPASAGSNQLPIAAGQNPFSKDLGVPVVRVRR